MKERILLHLLDHVAHREALEVPATMTQDGVARAAGVDLRHLAQYVRPLIHEGHLRERLAHVRGARQRRKVYDLTDSGRLAAVRLREKVKEELVRVVDGKAAREVRVADLLSEVSGRANLLDIVRQAADTGTVRIDALLRPPAPMLIEMLRDAPRVERFVGRREELEFVTRSAERPRIFVILGVAGIGKSTFAARACEILRGSANLFWHRVRPWDTLQSVLASLGEFLSAVGKPGLRAVLARGDTARASQVLREDLIGSRGFLVFDDVHEASPELRSFFRFLKDSIAEAPDVRALILTRRSLPIYDRRDVVLGGLIREISLPGLASDEIEAFLGDRPDAQALVEASRELGGHPLFLQLVRTTPKAPAATEARRDIRRFVEETIYADLSGPERLVMKLACLYRVPMPREAFFPGGGPSHDVFLALKERALVIPLGEDAYGVHDTIQEFFAAALAPAERRELAPEAVRALRSRAEASLRGGKVVACIDCLSNALLLAAPEERSDLSEALGDAHERLGDLPASLLAYKEALEHVRDPERAGRLHRKTADALQVRGEMAAAAREIEAARQALGQHASPEQGWIDLVRCRLAIQQEEWEEAREYGQAAIQLFRFHGDLRGQAQALLDLGNLEINARDGNPQAARQYLTGALDVAESRPDGDFLARAHEVMAHLLAYRFGDTDGAMAHIAAIESLPGAPQDPFLLKSLLMLKGWLSLELRADPVAAGNYFSEALAIARKTHDLSTTAFARYGLAYVTYYEERFEEAHRQFEQSATELASLGFDGFAVESLWMVAETFLMMEDLEGFRRIAAAVEDPRLARGVEARLVLVHVLRGLDALLRGDRAGCEAEFREALRLTEAEFAVQEWPLTHFVHFFYGSALAAMGRDEEAAEHSRRCEDFLRVHGLQARLTRKVNSERRIEALLKRAIGTV